MVSYKEAIKNTTAFKTVLKDKSSNRLSHTYLLVSEDPDYLKEFANMLAGLMLNIGDSKNQSRIDKGVHPDVIVLGENEKISTASVVELVSDVYVRPYEEENKVYILLNVNNMTEEAQNKLLKTIEEPPSSVYFILAATKEKQLLQTVLSRSKKLELDLLNKDVIAKMLQEAGINQKEINICSSCCNGVFSRAYKMATDKEFLNMYQNIFNCLYNMNSSRDVLKFTSIFNQKNINKEEFADLFMLITRDLIMAKIGAFELVNNIHKKDELVLVSNLFSLVALEKTIEYCLQLKQDLVYNTSIVASIDEFLLKVVEVKVRCKR